MKLVRTIRRFTIKLIIFAAILGIIYNFSKKINNNQEDSENTED